MTGTRWEPGQRPAWVAAAIDGAVDPLFDAARERFDADQLCEEAQLITGRLRILEHVRRDPDVLDERIVAPVLVTGSPRT